MPAQDIKALISQHKGLVVGAGAVVAFGLYSLNKNKNAAAGTTTAAAYDPTTGMPVGTAVSDTSGTDTFNALEPILAQLQNTVDGLNVTPVATSSPKPAPKPAIPVPKNGTPKPKPKPPVRHTGPVRSPVKPLHKPLTQVTVKRGDTLWGIAQAHHTTWQKIWSSNRGVIGSNPNLIKPGQRLTIP